MAYHDASAPIGRWESIVQDGKHLRVKGAIRRTVARGAEVWDLLTSKCLNGISVGYRPDPGAVTFDNSGRRTIRKAKLLECSIVAVPANARARITETLAYSGGDAGLAQRIATIDALWAKDISAAHVRLAEIAIRCAERIEASAAAGEIEPAQAAALLHAVRDGMRG